MKTINYFNGLLTTIFGATILFSGLGGVFEGYVRWLVGSGCIAFGIIGIIPTFKIAVLNMKRSLKGNK